MSMEKLMEEVKECVEHEYSRASDAYGPTNHSDHESYAIILEEFQEAKTELMYCSHDLDKLWEFIKSDLRDSEKRGVLRTIQYHALLAACEFIQVAATAYKALVTSELRRERQ